ncbi:LOW QUALITY PROTEIN: 39S ribosomal protein L19, mitochondrial [Acomys russatus]|uniref:LOW QUALITY PROTEIN: 39S ribosomal protein L19, mitochondrial n=1 Tax=Acomys russatus TaxID=60746 RepID=UPI0021E23857|nr:LOW QUALITY PROTEIN: 39S ribosomal protein L19, mitochondrial [Acomys russatus]
MAASMAESCRASLYLALSFRTARLRLAALASDACGVRTGQSRFQSTGTSEPGGFKPPPKPVIVDRRREPDEQRRFLSPEFIPPRGRTNPLKFQMERKDMLDRRKVLHIPEFYVGSILRVTTADPYASGKTSQFLGIYIQQSGRGLGVTFTLRNMIEGQGGKHVLLLCVDICFELYNSGLQEIQVVKLEKRLDGSLLYLRDALPEFSTFEVNIKPVPTESCQEVPLNKLKVKMKPKPWSKRWERPYFNIKGIRFDLALTEEQMKEAQKWSQPWLEFDMMREYDTSKIEAALWEEIEASKKS